MFIGGTKNPLTSGQSVSPCKSSVGEFGRFVDAVIEDLHLEVVSGVWIKLVNHEAHAGLGWRLAAVALLRFQLESKEKDHVRRRTHLSPAVHVITESIVRICILKCRAFQ